MPVGQYNEFDSNGLSKPDLAGIMDIESGGAAPTTDSPNDQQLCAFMRQAVPARMVWPVYQFDGFTCWNTKPSLKIQRYLDCSKVLEELVV